jgi:hypothetical protein
MSELDLFPPPSVVRTIQRDRCLEKTGRGNVYPDATSAEMAAAAMSKKFGVNIVSYHCPSCERYHIGRSR